VCPDDVPQHLVERFTAVWEARTLLDRSRWKQAAQAASRAIDAVGWDGSRCGWRAPRPQRTTEPRVVARWPESARSPRGVGEKPFKWDWASKGPAVAWWT